MAEWLSYQKQFTDSTQSQTKYLKDSSQKQKISKICMEPKKTLIAKSILAKYKNTGGIAILDYKI